MPLVNSNVIRKRMNKLVHIFVMSFLVSGCSIDGTPDETIPMKLGSKSITDSVKKKLDENGVWYRELSSETLEVEVPVPNELIQLINSESKNILPDGRHGGLHKSVYKEVLGELSARDIPYELVVFDGSNWLVWEESDAEEVQSVLDRAYERANLTEASENDFKFTIE